MRLLAGERVLYETASERLKVTTHRVRYNRQHIGRGTIKSIMLEEVASCAVTRLTYPWLLIFAAFCVLGGVLIGPQAGAWAVIGGLLLGLVFALAFLVCREQVVAIASAGATIYLNTRGWTTAEIHELLDALEAAKNSRFLATWTAPPVAIRP